jgi:RHS repeat-associated protein
VTVSHARPRDFERRLGSGRCEKYHPYGSTSWWAGDSSLDVSRKRYRYTGMERDEETGLQCHGVRYYAPWLGRWTSADPIGIGDGVNRYAYCHGGPVNATDRGGMGTVDETYPLPARSCFRAPP